MVSQEEEEGVSAEVESESEEIVEGKKPKAIIVKKSQDKESNLNFKW